MKIPRPIYVKWKDNFSLRDGWGDTEGYKTTRNFVECESVGYLMHETKDTLFLAINYCEHNNTSADSMAILKCCVLKKRFLK